MPRKPLRFRQDPQKPDLSGLARDVQDALNSVLDQELKESTGTFASNMSIGLPRQPRAIELIRCLNAAAPETPVTHGTAVYWVWRPQQGGAQVTGIQGLTVGATIYQFVFRITY